MNRDGRRAMVEKGGREFSETEGKLKQRRERGRECTEMEEVWSEGRGRERGRESGGEEGWL